MILVIGEALIDLIGRADSSGEYRAVVGGANANVALALARRGDEQRFLGRISSDGFGQQIRNRLASNSVNLELSIDAPEQTTLAVATIESSGSASYSFYVNGTADWGWTSQELPTLEAIASFGTAAIQYGCLTMAMGPGNLVIEAWLKEIFDEDHVTLSHDLNIRSALGFSREIELERVLRVNAHSHIIKASDADLEWLFDLAPGTSIDHIAKDWSADGKLVVITRGGDGASLFVSENQIDVAAPKINLRDTVGAGDTYMANLLGELLGRDGLGSDPFARIERLSDAQLTAVGQYAAVAAAIVCEKDGCEPPTKKEILARF